MNATPNDPVLREQLCAWMDGELAPDQVRFLLRRLAREPALRAQYERWQLAAACVRGQRVLLMPAELAPAVAVAVAGERRRGPWPWLATASALALVAVLMPAMPARDGHGDTLATTPMANAALLVVGDPAQARMSPMPPAVSELPLAESAQLRPWPRSPVLAGMESGGPLVVRERQWLPLPPEPIALPAGVGGANNPAAADAGADPRDHTDDGKAATPAGDKH